MDNDDHEKFDYEGHLDLFINKATQIVRTNERDVILMEASHEDKKHGTRKISLMIGQYNHLEVKYMSNDIVNAKNILGAAINKDTAKVEQHDNIIVQQQYEQLSSIDDKKLSEELTLLLDALEQKKERRNIEHQEAITTVMKAEKELQTGNKKTAVGMLKGAGKWVWQVAESVGAKIIANAIVEDLQDS